MAAVSAGRWRLTKAAGKPHDSRSLTCGLLNSRMGMQQAARLQPAAAARGSGKSPSGPARSSNSNGDADNLSQVFGPARTALPRNTSANRQADAMTALNAIEAATSWRQLPTIFSLVTKLPQNQAHLIAMAQALRTLSSALEAQYEMSLSSASDTSHASATAEALQRELQELQRFARELVCATQERLDSAYSPADVATLLRCFASLGVPPPDSWLKVSEATLLLRIQRISQHVQGLRLAALTTGGATAGGSGAGAGSASAAASLAEAEAEEVDAALFVLATATGYKLCGYRPCSELIQLLPVCASTAWASPEAKQRQGGSAGASKPASAVSPDVAVLASGEAVALERTELQPGGGAFQSVGAFDRGVEEQGDEEEELVVAHRPLPAECLSTLAYAMMAWEMPTDAYWLRGYVQAAYYGLCETVVKAEGGEGKEGSRGSDGQGLPLDLGLQGMLEVLWALIMQGICPEQAWLEEYQLASLALFRQQLEGVDADDDPAASAAAAPAADAGLCVGLMAVLRELGGAPGSIPTAEWMEAMLSCAARSTAPVAPAVIAQLLFDVGELDQPLTPDAQRCVMLLGQRAQILMAEEERRGSSGSRVAAASGAEDLLQGGEGWSPRGLALLLMGLVGCGVPPSKLSQGWLATWSRRAIALSVDFGVFEVIGVLDAAQEAGEQLPQQVVVSLLGARLWGQAPHAASGAGASISARDVAQQQGQVGASAVDELSAEEVSQLLSAALSQPGCRLPGSWMQPLRRLGNTKLLELEGQTGQEGAAGEAGSEDAARTTMERQRLCLVLMRVSSMLDAGQASSEQQQQQQWDEGLAAWLAELTQHLAAAGGLQQTATLVEAAKALGLHGNVALPLMQQVEQGCLACASTLEPEAYRHILAAFARTSHSPSQQWWEQLQSCLAPATARSTAQAEGSPSLDLDLAGILTATCVIMTTAPETQHSATGVCALLQDWACRRIDSLCAYSQPSTPPSEDPAPGGGRSDLSSVGERSDQGDQEAKLASALGTLLPALTALPEGLPHEACAQLCVLTQRLPGLGGLELARGCLDAFNASAFAAPSDWLFLATQDVHEQLLLRQQLQEAAPIALSPQDIVRLLTALALAQQQGRQGLQEDPTPQPGASTSQPDSGLPALLIYEAARMVGALSRLQLVQVLQAAAALSSQGTALRGAPGVGRLMAAVAEGRQPLDAGQFVAVLQAARALATPAEAKDLQQLAGCLLRPTLSSQADSGSAGSSTQLRQPGQQQVVLDVLCADLSALAEVVLAFDQLQVELPGEVVNRLLQHLAQLAASQPALVSSILQGLSGVQQEWGEDEAAAAALQQTASKILEAVASGSAPPSEHAAILSALAAVAQRSARDEAGRLPWLSPSELAPVVESCGVGMPQYLGNDLCTIIAALVALGAALPPTWVERFCDYAVPSQCSAALLPGAVMAIAIACSVEQNDTEEEDLSPADPLPWLRRMEAAVAAAPETLSCRDAALLFAACARQGYRPSTDLVQGLLDLALARAQLEQEGRTQQGPGPEAAGAVGLLVAANTSLGYTPTRSWADRAWDMLMPVMGRTQDPRLRRALDMALAEARAGAELV